MFRRTVRLLGDEMLHRFGAGRDRSAARLRALTKRWVLPKGGPYRGVTAVLLLRDWVLTANGAAVRHCRSAATGAPPQERRRRSANTHVGAASGQRSANSEARSNEPVRGKT